MYNVHALCMVSFLMFCACYLCTVAVKYRSIAFLTLLINVVCCLTYRSELRRYAHGPGGTEGCSVEGEDGGVLQHLQVEHNVGRPGPHQHLLPLLPRLILNLFMCQVKFAVLSVAIEAKGPARYCSELLILY